MNESVTFFVVDICFGASLVCGLLLGLFAVFPLEGLLSLFEKSRCILPFKDNSLKFCFSHAHYEPQCSCTHRRRVVSAAFDRKCAKTI